MITFFTTLKDYGPDQQRALESWRRLPPEEPEILLYTAEEEVAKLHEATRLPTYGVPATDGKPHVDALFQAANKMATYSLRAYVNADIVLLPHVWPAIVAVDRQLPEFMIISRRWDVVHNYDVNMDDDDWDEQTIDFAKERGRLYTSMSADIFCYVGEPWGKDCGDIPPYIIACYAWDNDLLCIALENNIPVVDITEAIPYGVIHQAHRVMGRNDPKVRHNLALMGRFNDGNWRPRLRGTQHATHSLGPNMQIRSRT